MVQIIFYRQKCIGCNACVEAAFSRWRISQKDGKCNLIDGREKKGIYIAMVNAAEIGPNKIAEQNCPVRCIKVQELSKKLI
ncbi:MAG: ferredoxin [Sphingobacteriaceae bacterium]|nr:ferredoxin [Sphingobacteriaceae bacterium]